MLQEKRVVLLDVRRPDEVRKGVAGVMVVVMEEGDGPCFARVQAPLAPSHRVFVRENNGHTGYRHSRACLNLGLCLLWCTYGCAFFGIRWQYPPSWTWGPPVSSS